MFWKRRNIIAILLILAAALSWSYGRLFLNPIQYPIQETSAHIQNTTIPRTEPTEETHEGTWAPGTVPTGWSEPISGTTGTAAGEPEPTPSSGRNLRFAGALLSLAAVLAGAGAVFLLSQREPLLGPDGAAVLLGTAVVFYSALFRSQETLWASVLLAALLLLSVRELWGWLRSRCAFGWCLCQRTARLFGKAQLPVLALWTALDACTLVYLAPRLQLPRALPILLGIGAAGLLCVGCLVKFGRDLAHLEGQLDRLRNSQPLQVRPGTFTQAEEALSQLQQAHQEAIRTAVTSERFKVDLIANVSHDLRTPLTAILGYGELLEKESLSPEGRQQLDRLNQKAGYMEALVESLFELTKVSSGVVEPKRESIDLIRLLEQTVGLYDDALTAAGLVVRRHYCAESLPLVTDGARLHQVFANLLGNAIKYALAGSRIHLEVRQEPETLRVRLVNTASYEMDFDPEEILQRFARGDKARSTQGSGLGLAIAQTYTESLGGQFRIAIDGDQFSAIVELPKSDRNL